MHERRALLYRYILSRACIYKTPFMSCLMLVFQNLKTACILSQSIITITKIREHFSSLNRHKVFAKMKGVKVNIELNSILITTNSIFIKSVASIRTFFKTTHTKERRTDTNSL